MHVQREPSHRPLRLLALLVRIQNIRTILANQRAKNVSLVLMIMFKSNFVVVHQQEGVIPVDLIVLHVLHLMVALA